MELQTLALSNIATVCRSEARTLWKHCVPLLRSHRDNGLICLALFTADCELHSLYLGLALACCGILIQAWLGGYEEALGSISWSGPLRFVRHPKALSQGLLVFGWCLATRSFPAMVLALLSIFCFFIDELHMTRASHEASVRRYKHFVPAFFPTVLPFRPSSPLRFHWRNILVYARTCDIKSILLWLGAWTLVIAVAMEWLPTSLPEMLASLWLFPIFLQSKLWKHLPKSRFQD